MQKTRRQELPESRIMLQATLKSFAAGLIAALVSLGVCSVMMTRADMPKAVVSVMSAFCLVLGGLFSGFFLSRAMRKKGLVFGLAGSAPISVVFLIAALAAGGGSPAGIFVRLLLILLAGAIGGVMGINTKRRKK